MVEFVADRDLVDGAKTNWDILPQIQIPLSKRLHILGNIAVRIPMNNTANRSDAIGVLRVVGLRGRRLDEGLVMESEHAQSTACLFLIGPRGGTDLRAAVHGLAS